MIPLKYPCTSSSCKNVTSKDQTVLPCKVHTSLNLPGYVLIGAKASSHPRPTSSPAPGTFVYGAFPYPAVFHTQAVHLIRQRLVTTLFWDNPQNYTRYFSLQMWIINNTLLVFAYVFFSIHVFFTVYKYHYTRPLPQTNIHSLTPIEVIKKTSHGWPTTSVCEKRDWFSWASQRNQYYTLCTKILNLIQILYNSSGWTYYFGWTLLLSS